MEKRYTLKLLQELRESIKNLRLQFFCLTNELVWLILLAILLKLFSLGSHAVTTAVIFGEKTFTEGASPNKENIAEVLRIGLRKLEDVAVLGSLAITTSQLHDDLRDFEYDASLKKSRGSNWNAWISSSGCLRRCRSDKKSVKWGSSQLFEEFLNFPTETSWCDNGYTIAHQ